MTANYSGKGETGGEEGSQSQYRQGPGSLRGQKVCPRDHQDGLLHDCWLLFVWGARDDVFLIPRSRRSPELRVDILAARFLRACLGFSDHRFLDCQFGLSRSPRRLASGRMPHLCQDRGSEVRRQKGAVVRLYKRRGVLQSREDSCK